MRKDWLILGGVTFVALLIVVAPLLPGSVRVPSLGNFIPSPASSVSILFVGDIMLDRGVASHAGKVGDQVLFAGVKKLFSGHDLVVANLEGAITSNASVSRQDNSILRFTFDPRFANILARAGVKVVSLANNHSLDFGEFGYEDTRSFLDKAGLASFGSPFNDRHTATSVVIKDKKICLVGYHELFRAETTSTLLKIETIRPLCDYVIVFSHWGEEYTHEPTARQRESAHAFIDAGADVVIGAHPHVVQPLEIYKNKAIFYSLGNFLFDQGFSPEVKRGVAVEIEFFASSVKFTLTPVNTFKEVSVADDEVAQAVFDDLGVATSEPFFLNLVY